VMLDKFNKVWEAAPQADGSYRLASAPSFDLGPGRPLGYHFDANGDLIVCDSYKARVFAFVWGEGRWGGGSFCVLVLSWWWVWGADTSRATPPTGPHTPTTHLTIHPPT